MALTYRQRGRMVGQNGFHPQVCAPIPPNAVATSTDGWEVQTLHLNGRQASSTGTSKVLGYETHIMRVTDHLATHRNLNHSTSSLGRTVVQMLAFKGWVLTWTLHHRRRHLRVAPTKVPTTTQQGRWRMMLFAKAFVDCGIRM